MTKRGKFKAYWFKDKKTGRVRRTPVLATSAKSAKNKLKRPSPETAVVVKSRELTAAERKTASKGNWVKGDFNRNGRGFGPKPKKS